MRFLSESTKLLLSAVFGHIREKLFRRSQVPCETDMRPRLAVSSVRGMVT